MEYHPIANIFPMMSDDEYAVLIEDIRVNGLREPIWTYKGKIVDGRNRWEACREIGIVPQFREWSGQGPLIQFVVSLNLSRRHLDSSQRATVALKIKRLLEAEAKERQLATLKQNGSVSQKIDQRTNDNSNHGKSAYLAAVMAGTNRQYVNDASNLERDAPGLLDLVSGGFIKIQDAKALSRMEEHRRAPILEKIESREAKTVKQAMRIIHQEEEATIPDDMPASLIDRCSFFCGEIDETEYLIEDESVDCIITAPPAKIEAYEGLAPLAARVLKADGSLFCTVSQALLPDVLPILTAHMSYRWTIALLGNQQATWLPVLWLSRMGHKAHKTAIERDTIEALASLVERHTQPGSTVLDPFMRNGAIVVHAVQMNRRVVGIGSLESLETTLKKLANIG